jgi:hypothetical protein
MNSIDKVRFSGIFERLANYFSGGVEKWPIPPYKIKKIKFIHVLYPKLV